MKLNTDYAADHVTNSTTLRCSQCSFHMLPVDSIGESPACARIHGDGGGKKLYVLCRIGACPMQVFSIT